MERLVGPGSVVLTIAPHSKRHGYTLQHVRYAASRLTVVYTRAGHGRQRVFGVLRTSPRYHTPGVRCFYQVTHFACEGGRGYEQPVTSFTVRHGRVVSAFMAAVAD